MQTYFIKISIKGTQKGLDDKCGGKDYNGSTICVSGLTCFMQNTRSSQCLQSCPQYWQCQDKGIIIMIN